MHLSDDAQDAHESQRLIRLTELYRAYAVDLQRYIYRSVGEYFLAEDLTSIVFLKALRWLKDGLSTESARGWLYATARTTIADHWQELALRATYPLTGLEERLPAKAEDEEQTRRKTRQRVQRLLDLLSERERRVLQLRYLQGYSAAEIAEVLGINAGHVRVLQLRALKRVAQLDRQERNTIIMQEQELPFDSLIPLLTSECQRAFNLARQEAIDLKHSFIGTEHLLWGLVSEGSLSSYLTPLGITPERIHKAILFIYEGHTQWNQASPQTMSPPDPQTETLQLLTPRTKQVVSLASEEMKSQGEQTIRPTHLFLGLLQEGSGIGFGILRSMGISLLQTRAALVPPSTALVCTFCGRNGSMVKRIFPAEASISNTPATTYICNLCVERFHTMLQP